MKKTSDSKQESKIVFYQNFDGPLIGSAYEKILKKDGFLFHHLSDEDDLLPYEDWRLSANTRATDLAKRLSIKQIAGLMLYSSHQCVPMDKNSLFSATYEGKTFEDGDFLASMLTDQQKYFLKEDGIRYVLLMKSRDVKETAEWNNELQKFVENLPFGIPVNLSTDPRHGADGIDAEFMVTGNTISKWPEGIGMSALFSPDLCKRFAQIAAKEYRALGICTALSPQIDLATEPRWMRYIGTFGTDKDFSIAMTKAYCDGMQTTEDSIDGWGKESVATMVKHWPGGGTGEGGRDAHYAFGAYAVYPGKNFMEHVEVFEKGAFALDGPTKCAASVMPYYTVSYDQDTIHGENVGNSYSEYIIKDLLRNTYQFDGVVCTDWGIMEDPEPTMDSFGSRCYNMEQLTEAERYLKVILNGVDQLGGINKSDGILKAYELGCQRYGTSFMRERMEASAIRLLLNSFRCGLFENPYLDSKVSAKIVGSKEFIRQGYQAQLQSVVMLKNTCLPILEKKKVYIPNRTLKERKGFVRQMLKESSFSPVSAELVSQYFTFTDSPEDADFAIVFMESPDMDGYDERDVTHGGNGYLPIGLTYRAYTATHARKESLAGGDFREDFTNRSYANKTNYASNESDLDSLIDTKKRMKQKPVIASIFMKNPCVLSEVEPYADAILVDFGVQKQVLFDLITGNANPSGLLPMHLPADMKTIELHSEDCAFDYEPFTDSCNHTYAYGFGMNFSGVICDERTKKWIKPKLK